VPRSDLAAQTRALFLRMSNLDEETKGRASVLEAWRVIFGDNGTWADDVTVMRSLSVFQLKLQRLREQVSLSASLDGDQKDIAIDLFDGLEKVTYMNCFGQKISEFMRYCRKDQLATLRYLSMVLKDEISEPTLSSDEIDDLSAQLTQLGLSVNDAAISEDLRKLLLHHIAYMNWAVRNIHIIGTDGVYEAFAPAALTAYRINETENDTEEGSQKRDIMDRIIAYSKKVLRILRLTDDGLQEIGNIDDDIQGLLP
jgi:hypothetical protein